MKATTLDEALTAADKRGQVTLMRDGRAYKLQALSLLPPFDASKAKRVKMPGLTGEDLDNIVREGRERGYQ